MKGEGFTIRAFKPEDLKAAQALVENAMPFIQRFSLIFGEGVFILEHENKVYGMIKGKILNLKSKKIGLIAWLLIDSSSQARGYAGPLMDKLLADFESCGCDEVLGCAHQLNTSSSGGMSHFGFKPVPLRAQIADYGLELVKVWQYAYHFFDYGHLLWRKSIAVQRAPLPNDSFLLHLSLQLLALFFMTIKVGMNALPSLMLTGLAYLFLRRGLELWVLKQFKLSASRYQGWESGHLLSSLVTAITGVWLICPGMNVPLKDRWRVKQWQKPMWIFSVLWLFIATTLGFIATHIQSEMLDLNLSGRIFLTTVGLELLLFCFPFQALLGGWIWNKNKWLWLLLILSLSCGLGCLGFKVG